LKPRLHAPATRPTPKFGSHLLALPNGSAATGNVQGDVSRRASPWWRLAGTTFPINRHYTAELLNFEGVYANSLDGVSDRDFAIEFLCAASLIMVHLSRLSEEV